MATGPRLVNKQFNSPIGLYSQQNIQDTLTRQTQVLNNGAMGIDFNNPVNTKPSNLANSAVLRMLEEEEQRQRNGQPGSLKRVAWPPPAEETNGEDAPHEAPVHRQAAPVQVQQSPALSRLIPFDAPGPHAAPQSRVYSPQPPEARAPNGQFSPVVIPAVQGHINRGFSPLSPQPHTPRSPHSPAQTFPPPLPESVSPIPQRPSSFVATSPRTFAPVSAQTYAPVSAPKPPAASPFNPAASSFAPVAAPTPKTFIQPQGFATVPAPTLVASPVFSPISPQAVAGQAPVFPTAIASPAQDQFVEAPPSTISLRPTAPVHQAPPPVFSSQPATNTFRGGVNMRGDQKWPPQNVKEAVEAENDARVSLAKGPACRPRRIRKDYTGFFAQNALPHNYPGYRAPPGTQHFDDATGQSQF